MLQTETYQMKEVCEEVGLTYEQSIIVMRD